MTELNLSGYQDKRELLAQRYERAGSNLFVVAMPLYLIGTTMPIPDPDEPFEDNRRVDRRRASAFSAYWRQNERWATPPLLLDTLAPLSEDFRVQATVSGVQFGILGLPYEASTELSILDGQHRILGWAIAAREVAKELKIARRNRASAADRGDEARLHQAEQDEIRLSRLQNRLRSEFVTVEILEGVSREAHKQYFHDIAVNAKGITKSLTSSFDRRQVQNRVAAALGETHPLLQERLDTEKDSVRGTSENWISGKNLVDITTAVCLGPGKSLTVKRREKLDELAAQDAVSAFLDALASEFTVLERLQAGLLTAADVRKSSLLGSPTILRGLAGAFSEIAVDKTDEGKPTITTAGQNRMRDLFRRLDTEMALPISDLWWNTGTFETRDSKAPGSRTQDLKQFAGILADWARSGVPGR